MTCEVIDYPAPQPLSALWARPDLGCAFMCGYPFATSRDPGRTLLAAPVPCPGARIGGTADLLDRHRRRGERELRTTRRRLRRALRMDHRGFAVRLAGAAAPARAARAAPRRPLFAATVGPLVTPREVALVRRRRTRRRRTARQLRARAPAPARARARGRLRVIAQTPADADSAARRCAGAPPPARRAGCARALAWRRSAPALAATRAALLLDGFAPTRRRRLRRARRGRAAGRRARLPANRVNRPASRI